MQSASDVHQASRLAHDNRIGATGDDIPDFVFHHRATDFGICYGKCTAKAAAGLFLFERNKFQSLDAVKQCFCFGFEFPSHADNGRRRDTSPYADIPRPHL